MKKWAVILLIATIVLSVVAISFFLRNEKNEHILSKVPINAKSVVVINLPSLLTKLVIDDFGGEIKSSERFKKLLPKELSNINWTKSGVSFLDETVLFTTKDSDNIYLNLILSINNYNEFDSFIDSLSNIKTLEFIGNDEKTLWLKQYETLISWNEKFVVLSKSTDGKTPKLDKVRESLLLKEENAILADSNFMNKQKYSFDVLFYSKAYKKHPIKYAGHINSNIESVISLINFNDGLLEIESELIPKRGSLLEKIFNVKKYDFAQLKTSDTCALHVGFNINSQVFFQILDENSLVKFNRNNVPYIAAWNGKGSIVFNGVKTIEKEYISYDYDDDFNKVEIKKVVKDKIWDIQAIFGVDKTILDSNFVNTKVYKSKKDTLLFKGSNFIVKNNNNIYFTYNKNLESPNILEKSSNDNVLVELNYKYFISLLESFKIKPKTNFTDKLNVDKLKLSINKKENINISCSFYFADKERNSLFSITKMWE